MKLIIREYLSALRERGELDAIIPELLSELGLNVFSRPGRGTRQSGVDVAAVGRLEGDEIDKVYLFSIKSGDLTRSEWNGASDQALRPSLDEILDVYIPTLLPEEHKEKQIIIAMCFGGDVKEQVRPNIQGYVEQHTSDKIKYEEWNGDKLATHIVQAFLREELVPDSYRSKFRKSLALVDEPEASFRYFEEVLRILLQDSDGTSTQDVRTIRQINLSLWVLFAWCRQANNLESSFLSSELAVLLAWDICKKHLGKQDKLSTTIHETFFSIHYVYTVITSEYLDTKIRPYVSIRDGLAAAVRTQSHVDVKLKLFDVLGRLALGGLWHFWRLKYPVGLSEEQKKQLSDDLQQYAQDIRAFVVNNQTLCLPIKDDQAIDIGLALMLLSAVGDNVDFIHDWLTRLMDRADLALHTRGHYPCRLSQFDDLLEHPKKDEGYLEDVTPGSILYPLIALWASIINDEKLYESVQKLKSTHLKHCTFQFWYPDESSEEHLYSDSESHGVVLTDIKLDSSIGEFNSIPFKECNRENGFKDLSVVKIGYWPLVLVACRHYRYPIPIDLLTNQDVS